MAFRSIALMLFLSATVCAKPVVVAHRGASGYLPEHTLEAAILAHAQGADFIEQDLVLSKDMVPVVLHDIHLETVTDVEQRFPERHRDDGRYYAYDFTLAELQTLRVHERQDAQGNQVFPQRYPGLSGYGIATFEQHIELISYLNARFGTNTGFYPEIKSPAWHKAQGADISKIVMEILNRHGLNSPDSAIFVQCFDFAETTRLREELGYRGKLVQLIGENDWGESATDYDYLKSDPGLAEIAKVADGIGPWIPQLIDLKTSEPTGYVARAHTAGLTVHPYTFRVDQLPPGVTPEMLLDVLFKQLKVDGVFTDFTDTVVGYR